MRNKFKKTIFIIILSIIVTFISSIKVYAGMPSLSVGSHISVGFLWKGSNSYKLTGTKWLYCIDNGGSLSSSKHNSYTVKEKVSIVGDKATSGSKSKVSKYNAGMAYILSKGGGYGKSKSKRTGTQKALWYYWNSWLSNVGSKIGVSKSRWKNHHGGSHNSIAKAAESYANKFENTGLAYIKGNEYITYGDKPYLAYKASFAGKIEYIKVTYTDGTTCTIKNKKNKNLKVYKTVSYDSKEKKYVYSNETVATSIASGNNFYILCKNNKTIKQFKIQVAKKVNNIYTATMYLLRSSNGSQKLMAVKHGKTSKTYKANIVVNVGTPSKGKIKIIKKRTICKRWKNIYRKPSKCRFSSN